MTSNKEVAKYSKLMAENNVLKGQHEKLGSDFLQLTAQKEKVIADNSMPEGRAKNRRIAIMLQPKD